MFSSKTDDFHGIRRKCLLFGQLALSQHIESIFFTKLFIFLFGSCADSSHSLKHFHFDERQQTRKIINSFFRINEMSIFFYSSEKFPIVSWQRNESYRSVSLIPESSLLLMCSICLQDINNSDHWVYRHIGSSSRFTLQMARLFVWGNEGPLHDTHSPQSETRPDFILSRQFSPFRSVDTISFVKSVLIFCSSNFDSNFAQEITLRYRFSFIISRRVFEKVHYGNWTTILKYFKCSPIFAIILFRRSCIIPIVELLFKYLFDP